MSKQPEALRLADMIERYNDGVMSQAICEDYYRAAHELRRLHKVNAELLKVLGRICHACSFPSDAVQRAIYDVACEAIDKAEDKQ